VSGDGRLVGGTKTVPECEVLSIVGGEFYVVDGVVSSRVQDAPLPSYSKVHLIMNGDSPKVDQNKEKDKQDVMKREDERKQIVWHSLRPAINRMEGMRRERGRIAVGVVWLMNVLIQPLRMESSVNPIDQSICKDQKERHTCEEIKPAMIFNRIV